MSRLKASTIYVGAGGVITFQGTGPGQAVYWNLVGHDADHAPVAAHGNLSEEITLTGSSGCAVVRYLAPAVAPSFGYHDHLTARVVL